MASKSEHQKICTCSRASKIVPDILETVGTTPLVKLNKIPESEGIQCEVLVKIEGLNPGGSIKDRAAKKMVEEAENEGILVPGKSIIIEPTSGETGIGLALVSAIKGYKCIFVVPEHVSNEKLDTMTALGAEIVKTKFGFNLGDNMGPFVVAQKLQQETPNSVVLNQFSNPNNPEAHYEGTGKEIYNQCDGKVDMIVSMVGSGGTVTGIGKFFKEVQPDCQIIAVDPEGSYLAVPNKLNETPFTHYELEGAGCGLLPDVLNYDFIDKWVKVKDREAFPMARRLIKEEGILTGCNGGAALAGALKACKELTEDQRCVVVLPDGAKNYMTRMINDNWMISKGFMVAENTRNLWWWDCKVAFLNKKSPKALEPCTKISQVLELCKNEKFEAYPVMNVKTRRLDGIITKFMIMHDVVMGTLKLNDPCSKCCTKMYSKINATSTLGRAFRMLERENIIAIEQCPCGVPVVDVQVKGFVTMNDIFDFVSQNKAMSGEGMKCPPVSY